MCQHLRFKLRTLLLLVGVVAVCIGYPMHRAKQRTWAIAQVENAGGYLDLAHYHPATRGGLSSTTASEAPEVPGPRWLRHIMGDAYFVQVVEIDYTLCEELDKPVDLAPIPILGEVEHVVLRGCRISPIALENLCRLRHITELDLSWTQVDDEGLACLQHLPSLQRLDLSHTAITDNGVAQLCKLNCLQCLALNDTNITDVGLEGLAGFTRLTDLELGGTLVTGAGLGALPTSLTRLVLDRSLVTDAGLATLNRIVHLERLMLYDTRVTNGILPHLKALVKLSTLDVSWTFATEDLRDNVMTTRKDVDVIIGPRVPDEDVVAIHNVVCTTARTVQQILRFRRISATQVEVLAATRHGQLNHYANKLTLVKTDGRWVIVSDAEVDM